MPFDLPRMSSHIRTSGHLFIRQSSVLSLPTMLGPIHHTLPPETLVAIMSYVCTDGGRMGCSLNLVCKASCSVCLDTGADIQSVFICSYTKMSRFLMTLCKRAVDKRKVVSLFLSCWEPVRSIQQGKPVNISLSCATIQIRRVLRHCQLDCRSGSAECSRPDA